MAKLCFGGSFNPIHVGHLICARRAAEAGGFESVVLIPAARSPHKPDATDLAAADHRVRMCQLVATHYDGFEADDLETKRTGPSYTIHTARELKRRGWPGVSWLIGADQLHSLPTWHEPQALLREVDFVVMARPGWSFDWDSLPDPFRRLRERVVETPLIDVSATQIRKRVATGLSIDFLVPEPVVRYIRDTGLYRT